MKTDLPQGLSMSEAEILNALRSDLAILKLTAQVKVLGSRLEIQARHAPGHAIKYDQVARFLRESLRGQQARNHPAFVGIQAVTVMIGVEGDPRFLYNATANLDVTEAGDREAETIDITSSAPTANPRQAETLYFDRQQGLAQSPGIPDSPAEVDPDAETLVVGRRPQMDSTSASLAKGSAPTAPQASPSPAGRNTSTVRLPWIVGGIVVAVVVLILVFVLS
jgi:hypothetical protein